MIGFRSIACDDGAPTLAAVPAWWSCYHLDQRFEGDLLCSEFMLEELEPLADGGLLLARRRVYVRGEQYDGPCSVLDWHLGALMP